MRHRLLAALMSLALASCASIQEPPAPPPPLPPRVMMAPPPREADVWPDGRVPMCFEQPTDVDQWAREQVRTAAATWEQAARVQFDIAENCDAIFNANDRRIPIRIVRNPALFASSSHLGNNLLRGGAVTLNVDYLVTNRLCGRRGSIGRTGCFYADALHELGHALGFAHDHVSAGAPNCRARMSTPEVTNAQETYYDAGSIMNYCNDERWKGRLSVPDVCSIQGAYGALDGRRPTRASCYALAETSLAGVEETRP